MKKRIISILLALMLCVGLLPVMALGGTSDIAYAVTGGSIWFNPSTGEIGSASQNVTGAVIPPSIDGKAVTSIGVWAFYGCSSLTSVTIPNSVTSIGGSAFCYCSSLTSVTIPNSVTSIGREAFSYCSSLTSVTIPNSVTSIGDFAFNGCSSLTSVTIPDSVSSIGGSAFYGCSSLSSITVSSGNTSYSSENGVLFNKGKTELLCYPGGKAGSSYTIPSSVTTIMNNAFYHCSSLTSVTIPDSATYIGYGAFQGCSSLASVTIPSSVTYIGGSAFKACSSLTSVNIPNGVNAILGGFETGGTFQSCSSLTNVIIPDSVKSIGGYAFFNCSSLTSITIPDSVTSIEHDAFDGCSSLKDVYYSGTKEQWDKINIDSYNDPLLNATIHFLGDEPPAPATELSYDSTIPNSGDRKVIDDTLSITFNKAINHNPNWSAGTIQIKDYDTDRTVLTIDNKKFYSMGGYVSGATLTIPNALSDLTPGGHYYVMVDKDLIWAAAANADGSVSTFAGFGDHEFHFVICPPNPTVTKTLLFRGTSINVDWCWDYFSGDARKSSANRNLAITALVLSAEDKSSDDAIGNLRTLGFSNPESHFYDKDKINRPAIVIGSTTQTINGEDKTIIALAIRGTTTLADWITDAGAAFNAFAPSIDFAYTKLKEYIDKYHNGLNPEDTILFITGHSLGGGVAGGLALRTDSLASRSSTFVYTFASTNYKTAGHNSSDYKNVINYINDSDLVPGYPIPTGPNSKVGRNIHYDYGFMSKAEKNNWQQAYSLITGKSFHLPLLVKQQHLVETYMAFLLYDLPYSDIPSYFNVAGIHCPVDVKVYNSDGALMASVTNGKVSHSSDTEVLVYVDGDDKYVIMPTEAEYRIELTGTDKGTMQYVVQQMDADTWEAKTEKDFSDIPLYSGKQMVNEVGGSTEVAGTRLFVLDEKGNPTQEITGVVKGDPGNPFTDVPAGTWYTDAVLWAVANGITNGTSETTFSPGSGCTRGQVATFLWRAYGSAEPKSARNPFTDVKSGEYYYKPVLWAVEKGVTNGLSASTFGPGNTCTRGQVVTFLWRAAGSPEPRSKTNPFADVKTTDYFYKAVLWAVENGITNGTSDTTFSPGNTCTRAHVVTFLYRAMGE